MKKFIFNPFTIGKERVIIMSSLIFFILSILSTGCATSTEKQKPDKPNFIVIFTDDLGYGDLGIYGDVIEEIDWSVGQVLKTLREEGLDENTMVVFTSDNGPWHIFKTHGGTAGLLQGAKGGTLEGGFRVPAIFRWPGKIEPDVVTDMGATMDLMPTICQLSGAKLPDDRVYDGYDISPALLGTGKSPRDVVFYYRGKRVRAVRKGEYKAHFITQLCWGNSRTSLLITDPVIEIKNKPTVLETPLLYNVSVDPSERFNIADQHPEIISEIRSLLEEHQEGIH